MVIPIMPKKEDKKENPVNTNTGNINNVREIDKDDIDVDIKDVTLGDFGKFVKIQDSLEKQIEKRNYRNQPISFGEKLGEKIEARMTDTIIDKMMTGMFNVGGSTTKPSGWLEIVKIILDSNFAAQAGAKLPETIQALSKTIGPQKTEQLADAAIQAVNPKAKSANAEDEQRKMEEFVLSLKPLNISDVHKFMELVNVNPANAKITDVNQARNILIEEQDRIRASNPELAKMLDENSDIDRGRRSTSPSPYPYPPSGGRRFDPFDNAMPRDMSMPIPPTSGSYNPMTPEEITSIDSNSDESVIAYAWRKGPEQFDFNLDSLYDKSNKSNLEKVRSMLRREQDSLLKGVEQGQLPVEGQTDGVDSKWDNKDIGKKARMNKDGEISIIPSTADSPVTEDGEVRVMKKSEFLEEIGMKPKENQPDSKERLQPVSQSIDTTNSMMELLQKMANNFDNSMGEINNKLQVMENRINKIEEQPTQIVSEKTIIPETETISEIVIEKKEEQIVDTIPEITMEEKIVDEISEQNLQEDQKVEDQKDNDIENQQSIQPIDVEDTRRKGGRIKLPKSILDEPKEENKEEQVQNQTQIPIKHPKGSFGWLEEQKRLKEQKANKYKTD